MQNTQKEPDQTRMVPMTQTQRDWIAHKAWALRDEARCLRQRFDQDLAGVLPVAPHPERPSLSLREVIEAWFIEDGAGVYSLSGRVQLSPDHSPAPIHDAVRQQIERESAAGERTDA